MVDGAGEPLIGVSVQVKGTQIGAITDFDGKFSIDAPANATLVVSYVGFKTQEVKVGNQSVLAIRLEDDNQLLDEVVVIGYGTMKKRDLTGSITSVKAEDIVRSPASNAMEALQGQVPGLDITRNSGSATSGVTINIRGQRSLSDVEDEFQNNIANQPLFIVDGMQGVNFADIAPSDIESIEVLKDASSTAIYGSQGANGVIIITTKKGKAGKPRVSYNGYIGVNGWPQYPDMLMGEDYMNVRRESYRTAGQWSSTADDASIFTPNEWEAIQNGDWTNWVDEVFHNGIVQNHQVTASGGTDRTTALLSAGFYQEQGSFEGDNMRKYNLRLNVEHKLWDVLVEPARKIRIGNKLYFGEGDSMVAEVIDNTTSRGRTLRFLYDGPHDEFKEALFSLGQTPLPLYIDREPTPDDVERFQCIFAKNEGAVVAPAAGLHFSREVMKRMEIKGINYDFLTLHFGLGNFREIDVEDLTKHRMDSEQMEIRPELVKRVNETKDGERAVCAVGTSVLRAIASAVSMNGHIKEYSGWTNKFIFPPYDFSVCTSLVTNFHMPYSTMLMMTAAFGGYDAVMNAYEEAVKEKYRFGVYGDAMLIL